MLQRLEEEIRNTSAAKIRQHERYLKRVADENERRKRRTSGPSQLAEARRPETWLTNKAFDPYHVRARARRISYTIEKALQSHVYRPMSPYELPIPKRDGTDRLVTTFAIADEVISRRVYRLLLGKNRAKLSGRSYAYRDDLTVYDAVSHIQTEFRNEQRVFVAEYDFSDFFNSISHDHIWRTVSALRITMTPMERRVIRAFLAASPISLSGGEKNPLRPRGKGILQGTSISLFLANLAASPLDAALERLGVKFVRYADDTLIWSRDYASICRAVEEIHSVSERMGSPINQEKSMGVRLLVPEGTRRAEISYTTSVNYLSHSIGLRATRPMDRVVGDIRQRVGRFIYDNLLRQAYAGQQNLARITHLDKDYAVLIWQLRRLLYGPLSENDVRRYGRQDPPRMPLSGAIARLPLVTDEACLRSLDGWIARQVWLGLRRRQVVLEAQFGSFGDPLPWGMSIDRLVAFGTTSKRTKQQVDLRMPSAVRMARLVRHAVRLHGLAIVGDGRSLYVDSLDRNSARERGR